LFAARTRRIPTVGFRFYRRLPIIPGVRLNVATRGVSVSFGHRGAWYTVGSHGRRTATLGWPGTGLRYTVTTGGAPRKGVPLATSAAWGLLWLVAIAVVVWLVLGAAGR
jgi:hypothetical protein